MRLAVLGSGSSGNAVLVESAGRRLLVDAGFQCREIDRRLAALDRRKEELDAVVFTHEHGDHVRGAAVLLRKTSIPCYATAGTYEGTPLPDIGTRRKVLQSGRPVEVAGFRIEPFAIPHDAKEPIGVVIEDGGGCRVGLVADIGTRSKLAWGRLRDLDALILETNHDLHMLHHGPYSWALKQRIAGRHGHLSNVDAADGLPELITERLQMLVLYHLSRTNNTPEIAAETIGQKLDQERASVEVVVSEQDRPTAWLELRQPRGVQQSLFDHF
jgi:phosphoribosyl 1,2-cyclic phosphodiesterase